MDTTERPVDDDGFPRGAQKKEAYHQACEEKVQPFKFTRPGNLPMDRKAFVHLGALDNVLCHVQIINEGGDNGLHYHPNMDSVFYVMKGSVKVYGPGDTVIGDFGPNEGCMMPAGARYWFETSGDEESWLLHTAVYRKGRKFARRIPVEGGHADKPVNMRSVHYAGDTHEEIEFSVTGDKGRY